MATASQVYNALRLKNLFNIQNSSSPVNFSNFEDITDWVSLGISTSNGDTVDLIAQVISPTGLVAYENVGYAGLSFASPDTTLISLTSADYNLPTYTGSTTYVNGSYVVNIIVQVTPNGLPAFTVSKTFTFDLPKNVTPKLELTETWDCATALYTSNDTTTYCTSGCASGYSVTNVERLHTVYPPAVSGQSDVSASTATIVLGLPSNQLWTGTYEAKLEVIVTLAQGDSEIITHASVTAEAKVICDDLLCGLYCHIKSIYNQFKASLGRNTTQSNKYQEMLTKGFFAYNMARQARLCSDENIVAKYVQDFYDFTGADPNCDCCDNESSPVIPTTIVNGTNGTNGETPTFRVTGGTIFQYKFASDAGWTTIFDFSTITGLDGLSFLQGSGVPSSGLGVNGDSYLDLVSGDIYLKATGTWSVTGNMRGADGVVLEVNEYTTTATTGTVLEVLKSYTIPANTFSANGDMLEIDVHYFGQPTSATLFPPVNTGNINVGADSYTVYFNATGLFSGAKYAIKLTRISSTTLKMEMTRSFIGISSKEVVSTATVYYNMPTTYNFANSIALTFDAIDTITGETSIQLFRIKKYSI